MHATVRHRTQHRRRDFGRTASGWRSPAKGRRRLEGLRP